MSTLFLNFVVWYCLGVILVHALPQRHRGKSGLSLDSFPNPLNSPEKCGRYKHPSYVCDPDEFLSNKQIKSLNKLIKNLTESSIVTCKDGDKGLEIGVAIINRFNHYNHIKPYTEDSSELSYQMRQGLSIKYAKKIHDTWGVGHKYCNNGMLIFITIHDRYIYISTGKGIKGIISDAFINDYISVMIRDNMRHKRYYNAIYWIIERIYDVLLNKNDLDNCQTWNKYLEFVYPKWHKIFGVWIWLPSFGDIIIACFVVGLIYWFIIDYRKKTEYNKVKNKLAKLHAAKMAKKFDQSSCPICLDDYKSDETEGTRLLFCGHKFHKDCIDGWFAQSNNDTCPICRKNHSDWKKMNPDGKIDEEPNDNNNNNNNNDYNGNDYDNDSNTDNNNNNNSNDYNNRGNGGKTLNDETFYDSRNNTNVNAFTRFFNEARYRGRNNTQSSQYYRDQWMYENELRFRLNRMRHLHPNYINNDMVNRFSSRNYNGPSFECDSTFESRNPFPPSTNNNDGNNNYSSSSWGSGSGFSGGSSSGGGGGGGSW